MYSDMNTTSRIGAVRLILCALVAGYSASTMANDETLANDSGSESNQAINFSVSPITCVALHKRQVCHKTISLSWSSLPNGQYCLHTSESEDPLKCWQDNKINSLAAVYKSATKVRYELREVASDSPIAHAIVNTAWVYRTSRRSSSGWRLF